MYSDDAVEPLSEGVGEVVESGGVELSGNDGLALIEYERVKSELDDELSEADPVDVLASDVERLLENGTAGGVEGTYGEGVLKGVVRDEFHIPAVCDSQPGDLKRNGTGSGSVFGIPHHTLRSPSCVFDHRQLRKSLRLSAHL